MGGALLLSLAAAVVFIRARRMGRQRQMLSAWVELLSYAHDRIACFGTPLPDILRAAPPCLKELTRGRDCDDFSRLCRIGAEQLEGEGARLLSRLADEVGGIWRQEQLTRLEAYASALRKEKTALDAALPQRLRLEGTLTLCGTLALILLIW